MKQGLPSAGVVTLAALDLRRAPDHRSELRSQLLMGETVQVLRASRDREWWWVRNHADGYAGWIRTWGLVPCTIARAARWRTLAAGRVMLAHAEIRTRPGTGALVSPVYWNGRLIAGPARSGYRRAELPDGRNGWIEAPAVSLRRGPGIALVERIERLLGISYLWGGRTPLGFDCSSLVQQLLDEQGVRLPRDAHDQFLACAALVRGEDPRLGDLLFFGNPRERLGHVGMYVAGGLYVHARGRVRIGSLDLENPMCDRTLLSQLRSVRRPVERTFRDGVGRRLHRESA